VEAALERARGVISQAARDLGLSRQALYRRMEKLGLRTDASRPSAGT
jgi:transcriptional regulator of acetoin/glycerol metabolism